MSRRRGEVSQHDPAKGQLTPVEFMRQRGHTVPLPPPHRSLSTELMPTLAFNHGTGSSACARGLSSFFSKYMDTLPSHPRGVLVVEAHIQASPVLVGGDPGLASDVEALLGFAGIDRRLVSESGLPTGAHGVSDVAHALDAHSERRSLPAVPVAYMSVLGNERDAQGHLDLGKALATLREQGILIVGSGLPR